MKLDHAETNLVKKILFSDPKPDFITGLSANDRSILDRLGAKLSGAIKTELYVDGAANLADKRAGIGGLAFQNGQEIFRFADQIGEATNNQAEYRSLIRGMELLLEYRCRQIKIYMDSELVVRQIKGAYRVKNERMKPLYSSSVQLLSKFDDWEIAHVPRTNNRRADQLSKEGLKKKLA